MQAIEWEGEFPVRVRARFPSVTPLSYLGQGFLQGTVDILPQLLAYLKVEEQFEMLTDLTAVDHPVDRERFEIVYILYSLARNTRVRVKTWVAPEQAVPSVVHLYAGANWLEREVYDMFGVRFDGHPDLKRILLPEDWTGFPLRKESSITGMDEDWVKRNLGIESGQ